MKSEILAWHFVGDTLRDGRPVPADSVKLIHASQSFKNIADVTERKML